MSHRLAFYIHIPYCLARCGYCDFNTYTPRELQSDTVRSLSSRYIESAIREIELASARVGAAVVPSIFFGGGTPSLMAGTEIASVINTIRDRFELASDAEITIEVNPDSVTSEFLALTREAGANRISMGMQSAKAHVLAALDRTHSPESVPRAVELVRSHGYEHCSVDLIYGTPGESIDDWRESVAAALSLKVDHLSAYALIVEKGTKLAARVKSGELIIPPEDETATKYEIVDEMCGEKGFHWYELSNWSAEGGECRHNISYWDGSHWWGVGPGAHSYFNGVRWWNVKHPETYQSKIKEGKSPMLESEELSEQNRRDESIMLRIRMREGIPLSDLSPAERERVGQYLESNHLYDGAWTQGKLVLTRSGRLIADRIVREILV